MFYVQSPLVNGNGVPRCLPEHRLTNGTAHCPPSFSSAVDGLRLITLPASSCLNCSNINTAVRPLTFANIISLTWAESICHSRKQRNDDELCLNDRIFETLTQIRVCIGLFHICRCSRCFAPRPLDPTTKYCSECSYVLSRTMTSTSGGSVVPDSSQVIDLFVWCCLICCIERAKTSKLLYCRL